MRLWLGFFRPRNIIPGTEFAGEIEAIGRNVTYFKVGDRVFGSSGVSFGTNAEYKCLPETGELAVIPADLSYEEATAIPFGGRDALHFLRQASLRRGQRILIVGAGGSIGTFAVQLAKHFGAEVTVVDSDGKLDMLRSIGADHVMDYAREDFTRSGEAYDVVFDTVGKTPFCRSLRSLNRHGRYLLANPQLRQMILGPWISMASSKKVVLGSTSFKSTEELEFLKLLIKAGNLKPVIDRVYPLEQIVEAHRYVETGHKKGNVIITV
jgi:NADPH:quinone reductase-like Zn-dependent oxidoreductase